MRQSRRTELRASAFGQELFLVSSKFGVSETGAGAHGGSQKIKSLLERGPFVQEALRGGKNARTSLTTTRGKHHDPQQVPNP